MMDSAISYSAGGSMEIQTYGMDGKSVGMNDFGEPLYDFGGVTMTEAQANENSDYFLAEDDGYGNSSWDQDDDYEYDDTLPAPMLEGLHRINDALGGEGAADFIASELLAMGESRMDEVLRATHMDKAEVQSYANAVLIDLAADVGMDHNMLMNELGKDIKTIRSMRSDRGMNEMHDIISSAVAGRYDEAMKQWDRLRGALSTLR